MYIFQNPVLKLVHLQALSLISLPVLRSSQGDGVGTCDIVGCVMIMSNRPSNTGIVEDFSLHP